jgi:formate/nitrite transporter
MDHWAPDELMADVLRAAKKKAHLPVLDLLLRGALAGGLLACATSFALIAVSQGMSATAGALLFPVGFVMLILLGFELVTGNFATLAAAWLDRRISLHRVLRNWLWVYLGNLLGGVAYAALFYAVVTNMGTNKGGPLGEQIRLLAQNKTIGYSALGAAGWTLAFIKGALCNWLVTTGSVLAFVSRSTVGKILAMWMPITTFFALGFEHSVVNMFVIPVGMMLGATVSARQWWIWNQIPVTIGNLLSGVLLTGAALWYTHARRRPERIELETEVLVGSTSEFEETPGH